MLHSAEIEINEWSCFVMAKILTAAQYLKRYKARGRRRAPKTRMSDLGGTPQPKWDGGARTESSSWQPNGIGEAPSWIRRIGE